MKYSLLLVSLLSLAAQAQNLVVADQLRAPLHASEQQISKVAVANPAEAPLADGVDFDLEVTSCSAKYYTADNDWYVVLTMSNGWVLYLDYVSSTFAGTFTYANCLPDYTFLSVDGVDYVLTQADIITTGNTGGYYSISVRATLGSGQTLSAKYVVGEQYDQKSDLQVSFTTEDKVDYTLYDGFAYWKMQSAGRNDVFAFLCNTESGKGPKAGVFPINGTGSNWTVQGGSVTDGSVYPTYYGLLNSDGYISSLWLVHSGTVTITDVDGDPKHMWIEVDAINTWGNHVKISYNAQSTSDQITYTTTDGKALTLPEGAFGDAKVLSHSYGTIRFDRDVTTIAKRAFQSQQTLKTVILPSSLTTIGQEAFEGCSSLVSVELPKSVTTLGKYAFAVCANLQSVTLPSSLTVDPTVFRYSPLVQVNK